MPSLHTDSHSDVTIDHSLTQCAMNERGHPKRANHSISGLQSIKLTGLVIPRSVTENLAIWVENGINRKCCDDYTVSSIQTGHDGEGIDKQCTITSLKRCTTIKVRHNCIHRAQQ